MFLEVTREHGTYQLMREKIDTGGGPFSHEIGGNVEVKSATVRFGPGEGK